MEEQLTLETARREERAATLADDVPPGWSRLRAALRLAAFFLITGIHLARAIYVRLFRVRNDATMGDRTHLLMQWSRALNRALGFEVAVTGAPPEKTVLLVSNHRSYMDITAIGSCLPVTFLAKKEVARWPLIGPGCRLVNVVFVERESGASRWQSREEIALRLKHGMSIVVFPEGTSFEGPGLLPFRPGVFSLAAAGGFSVVPVAVSCAKSADAWVGDDTFIRHFMQTFSRPRVRITVSFGPVMMGNDPDRLRSSTWRWIDETLKQAPEYQ